ncbi:MAG: putative extracellular nuclease, partial [Planctomycetaceae bacterium]|nr:putative extracellular nuclease [Planctomycetaceae bacterium]
DFNLTQGTVTFLANQTSMTVSVPIIGDTTAENNETFFLNLSNPTNATIADGQGLGTILNDDNSPPVVTLPPGPLNATEDVGLAVVGISVADPDANGAVELVTLIVQHGTLNVRTDVPSGLLPEQILNNGTNSVTFNATLDAINNTLASLSGLVYQGIQDYNGTDTLTVTANDLGNTGNVNIPKSDTESVLINVANVNDPPIIDFHGAGGVGTPPSPIQSTKGNAVAAFGSPNVITLTDADNTNFNGGTIVATNVGPFIGAKDLVSIRNQGTGSGEIGFSAKGKHKGQITYNGVVIGNAHGGTGGSNLVITLNSKASVAATQALLRNITFGTSKTRLAPVARNVQLTMTDGSGGTSQTVTTTINVTN